MSTLNASATAKTSSSSNGLPKTGTKRLGNASEVLQKYIEQFSNTVQTNPRGTPNAGCYGSSNVFLLSTKPESFLSPRKAANSTGKPGEMADNLVQWVNESYSKDLQRKIVPFGQGSCSSVGINDLESRGDEDGNFSDEDVSTISGGDVQLSSLPSPRGSVASDLDSNVESVNTEILVKSFHNNVQPSGRGGTVNHPSWVEELTAPKHYPSWLDEVDQSSIVQQETKPNGKYGIRNRLSRSLSPSFFQEHPHKTASSILSTSLQEQPIQNSAPKPRKSRAWDLESTDTEVLISEPIYGRKPVNMGGAFHNSLYHDRKINQLHDHSVRKFAEDVEKSLLNEISFVESNSGTRKRGEETPTKSSTNTKSNHFRTSIPKLGKNTTERSEENVKSFYRHNKDPQRTSDKRLPQNSPRKKVMKSATRPTSLGLSKGNGFNSPSELRKNSTDSSNTDRLMRKSPTGIEMIRQDSRNISNSIDKHSELRSTQPSIVRPSRNATSPRYNKDVEKKRQISSLQEIRPQNLLLSSRSLRTGTSNKPRPADVIYGPTSVKASPRSPRISASEELQRIIDFSEKNNKQALRKDYYLNGKVSKKDINRQNYGVTTSDDFHSKRTPITSTSIREHGYPTRLTSRDLPPTRLVPSERYYQQSSPRNGNPLLNNYRSVSYERNPPRRRVPWNSDPNKSVPVGRIRYDKLGSRSRTKSAPGITRNAYNARIVRDADYAKERRILDASYADERESLLEDTDSVDTEALIIKPPMPLFDVSPSLSTVSPESDTSSEESGNTMIENLALRTSLLATDTDLQSSGTSYKDLPILPRNDEEQTPEWRDDDSSSADTSNRPNKPGIIASFIEDCMTSSLESVSDIAPPERHSKFPEYSGEAQSSFMEESSDRPVETLKKMLFTVQRLANSSEEDSGEDANNHSFETQSETLTEEVLSEILSTASRNEGQDSLSRAYYHLARLKRLVSASQEVAEWR